MNGILLVFTGRTSSLLEGRWRYCLGWGTFPWSFCTKKHAIRDFERRFSLPVAWTTSTMYVVQASKGSQGAKNTSSSRMCLALRVCLALALRLPRTCLRSPCKTLKMQANCYPPPPPKGQPLILLQASFLRWNITSITNKLIYFLLEPLFGSYTITHTLPTRKPLSEEELSENEAGCNTSFFLFSSWTTEYSVDNTLPKAISTHDCIITGH